MAANSKSGTAGGKSEGDKWFRAYDSIDHLEGMALCKFEDDEFVGTEKVHGSNYSMSTDGTTFSRAKHSSILTKTDNMYDNIAVFQAHKQRLLELHAAVSKEFGVKRITVYGEIFGGGYPVDPAQVVDQQKVALKSIGIAKPVQKRPWYSPDVQFYAFDIYLPEPAPGRWLTFKRAQELFQTFRFLHAEPLVRGTLRQIIAQLKSPATPATAAAAARPAQPLADAKSTDAKSEPSLAEAKSTYAKSGASVDVKSEPSALVAATAAEGKGAGASRIELMESWIPGRLGLAPVAGNVIEGLVLRRFESADGKSNVESERVILKVVTKHFRESIKSVNPRKYDALSVEDFKGVKFAELYAKVEADLMNYVTANRLEHVVSKIGPAGTQKQIIGSYVADVLKSFKTDFANVWEQFMDADQKTLSSAVARAALLLVQKPN